MLDSESTCPRCIPVGNPENGLIGGGRCGSLMWLVTIRGNWGNESVKS